MSAARARRRLMRFERYWRRALLLDARPCLAPWGSSAGHANAQGQALSVGRPAGRGQRGEPWTLSVHRAGWWSP